MSSLKSYVIRRLALIPVSIFILVSLIFFLLRVLPGGNPVLVMNSQLPPEKIAWITQELGLDKPYEEQYVKFIIDIFINFDFGNSYESNTPILNELLPRFMATLELSILASLIGIPLGIFIGTFSGRHRGTNKDHAVRMYTIAVYSIPIFWLGIWMQVFFAKILKQSQGQLFGWIPANLRTGNQVTPYINKVTGIYSIDSLLFSGSIGWEAIYFFISIALLISFVFGYIYYLYFDQSNKSPKKDMQISEIRGKLGYILLVFSFSIISLLILFNNDFSILINDIFGSYTLGLQVLLFFFGWIFWIMIFRIFTSEEKQILKKFVLIGFILSILPLIVYFYESWFIARPTIDEIHEFTSMSLFQDVIRHLILPSITLGLLISGVVARLVRTNMITVMFEQFIDSSRARGIPDSKITYNYGLKNATVPAIPLIGLQFAVLLGGAILTETTFSYFGLGLYLYHALLSKNFPAIQAAIVLFAISVAIVSFVSDLTYAMLDKRVRL